MLMREPNGNVQLVALTHGSAIVPVPPKPPPPVHVALVATCVMGSMLSSFNALKMFPEETSPVGAAACTTSTRLLIVSVSCASSTVLRAAYEQLYGAPTAVGLVQPLVNAIPCCTSICANAFPLTPTTN